MGADPTTAEATASLRRSDAWIRRLAVFLAVFVMATGGLLIWTMVSVLDDVRTAAEQATAASRGNRQLLERNNPCLPGDPPESQPCVRQRQTDAIIGAAINRISEQVVAAVAEQHGDVRAQHEELKRAILAAFADPAVRGAFRGAQGEPGQRGPAGPTGPQGPPGPPGLITPPAATLPTIPPATGLLDRLPLP